MPEPPDVREKPEPSSSDPLSPDTVLPLLSNTTPDAPSECDAPPDTLTAPDVTDDSPELSMIEPVTSRADTPLANLSEPDEPLNVVPLLSTIDPLTPEDSAFALRIVTSPDDDDSPPPLTIDTTPPVLDDDVVEPACSSRLPPTPLVVEPTSTDTAPAEPLVAAPLPTIT
jgi:hypothetical protein